MRSQVAEVNYPEVLGEAWELHLVPREPDAPTVVSLFAGCGGSSLGYSMAGYRELLATDHDEKCAETFRANFPGVPFLVADIRELSAEALMEAAGLAGPGELDVLDGSPPCQGFSTAGKRDLWDPRNELYREFARLLEGTRPRAFVMENVSGMIKGKMKLAFADCTRALKAAGYRVSCRLMDAKWFLVPQERKRLIWVGVREDLAAGPSHPAAKNRKVTVRQALAGIENLDGPLPVPGTKLANCCRNMRQGQSASEYYGKNWGFNLFRLDWDSPAPVFTKGGGACGLIHPALPRKCIKEEYQALMSYPRQFQFAGNEMQAREQIANSVPPLMMRTIASRIRSLLAQADAGPDQAGAGSSPGQDVGAPQAQGQPAHVS